MDEQINVGINVESGDVKQLDIQFQKVDQTVNQIIDHLTQVENKILNINKTVNQTINKNYNRTKNYNKKGTFIDNNLNTIVGVGGTAVSSNSTRSKAYQQAADDYHIYQLQQTELLKQQLETEKEITRLKKQLANTVQQEADTRSKSADARLKSAQYKNSPEHLYYEQGLGLKHNLLAGWYAEKSANPDKFLPGANLRSWKYQTGRMLSGTGNVVSSLGLGGKVAGLALDSLGAFFRSIPAGVATTLTNLAKGIRDLGKEAVEAFSEIESIKTQLGVVFSNQTQADTMFGEISQYAVKSPFGVQQTSELAVLLKQSGVYASDLMDTLRMLGDTAGGNMEKMKRIANNYAQIVSIGKASMLDMRQFAYAGIPIFEAVSKELKVSQQELRKMISDGKVTSDIIEKVFKDLTGINGIFNEATSRGAKTLKARLQNLKDAQQLAFGSVGEWLTSAGAQTGGDSYANRLVSFAENIYSWLKEKVNTKNIENSVKVIEKRNDRIKQLQDLIEYNKDNKEAVKYLQEALARELAKRDIEKERATYEASYEDKMANYEELFQRYGNLNINTAKQRYWAMKDWQSSVGSDRNMLLNGGNADRYKEFSMLDDDSLSIAIKELKEYIDLLGSLKKVTEEEIKAHKETLTLNAQQLAYDQASKNAEATGSLASRFQELASIYKESDEYKEKEEKKRQKSLEEAKDILKKIAANTDETGTVDLSKYNKDLDTLYNLFQNGALTPGRQLQVVEGKNSMQKKEDRELLVSQLDIVVDAVKASFKNVNAAKDALVAFTDYESIKRLNDDKFYENFPKIFVAMQNSAEALVDISKNTSPQLLQRAETYKYLLPYLLSTYGADTTGENADIKTTGKLGQEFIPLWKRILAQATGLSAEGIISSAQTLSNYRNDMSVRNITSNVIKEVLKNSSMSTAMGLVKASNNVAQLQGTSFEVVQVDWKATRKAVKDFALQLSASTDVITAYKKSLEEELDTFQNLVAAGYTQAESQDIKNQKYVKGETYSRLLASAGSQLVNAFGENLKTKEGQEVWLRADGKFYDAVEGGNEVAVDELILTENLFEIIKSTLPEIQKELHEANVAELDSSVLKQMFENVVSTTFMSKFLQSSGDSILSNFANEYPEYIADFINSYITAERSNYGKEIENLSNSDLAILGTRSNEAKMNELNAKKAEAEASGNEEAIKKYTEEIIKLEQSSMLLNNAFNQLFEHLKIFADSDTFQDLKQRNLTKTRDDALNADWLKLTGSYRAGELSPTAWPDQGGYSWFNKFVKDFTGVDSQYTMEDLYNKGISTGGKMKRYGLFGKEVEWNAGGDMVTLDGNQWFGEGLIEETLNWNKALQDTLDTMKSLGEETSNLVGQIGQKAFLTPFEKMGEQLVNDKLWTEQTADAMADLGAEALSALGPIMAKAGFELVARGALNNNWAMITGGLALAAAGGFASGLGGALSEAEKDTKDDKQAEKLQSLKDQLADLLDQARRDALYYENNLRHKTALGINKEFDYQSVNDAIITPQGSVITTDPKDYLIATKTPGQFGGGNVTVTPIINCNVVNNTNAKVTQQQVQNPDGSIDILTIIEDKMGEYIASSKSDDAFASREYRIRGKQSIMN